MASDYIRREWERKVYAGYNWLIDAVLGLIPALHTSMVRIREALYSRFEYYLASDGSVKRRFNTGLAGVYSYIEGKLVKVAQGSTIVVDDMSIIGWKECQSGKFDEDLGTIVESKQHYKKLMNEKNLVPLEPAKYCGSNEYRQKKARDYRFQKAMPTIERKFVEACKIHGSALEG